MAKFLTCAKCGKTVGVIKDGCPVLMCCGEPMQVLGPRENGEGEAKHVPVLSLDGNILSVNVGSIDHPMMEEHSIEWVYLETNLGGQRKILHPGDKPHVEFLLLEGEKVLGVYAHCNLHGLWKATL